MFLIPIYLYHTNETYFKFITQQKSLGKQEKKIHREILLRKNVIIIAVMVTLNRYPS